MEITMSSAELRELVGARKKPRRTSRHDEQPTILMTHGAYLVGMKVLSERHPEAAGVLLGPSDGRLVTQFVPDDTGNGTDGSFTFDHVRLNEILRKFRALGIDAKGFWHSPGYTRLSKGDLAYAAKIFLNPKSDAAEVFMPIVSAGVPPHGTPMGKAAAAEAESDSAGHPFPDAVQVRRDRVASFRHGRPGAAQTGAEQVRFLRPLCIEKSPIRRNTW